MRYRELRELETPRHHLRRLTMEDVPQYFHRLFGRAAVARYMLWEPHTEITKEEWEQKTRC